MLLKFLQQHAVECVLMSQAPLTLGTYGPLIPWHHPLACMPPSLLLRIPLKSHPWHVQPAGHGSGGDEGFHAGCAGPLHTRVRVSMHAHGIHTPVHIGVCACWNSLGSEEATAQAEKEVEERPAPLLQRTGPEASACVHVTACRLILIPCVQALTPQGAQHLTWVHRLQLVTPTHNTDTLAIQTLPHAPKLTAHKHVHPHQQHAPLCSSPAAQRHCCPPPVPSCCCCVPAAHPLAAAPAVAAAVMVAVAAGGLGRAGGRA